MALISMTGFGRGEASSGAVKVEVELSSVNRKQLEIRLSLPRPLSGREAQIQEIVNSEEYQARKVMVQSALNMRSNGG